MLPSTYELQSCFQDEFEANVFERKLSRDFLEDELKDLIKNHGVSRVCIVGSPWVAIGSDACLVSMGNTPSRRRAVVVLPMTSAGKHTVDANSFVEIDGIQKCYVLWTPKFGSKTRPFFQSITRTVWSLVSLLGTRLVPTGKPIEILAALEPPAIGVSLIRALWPRYRISFFLIEDGFLNYASKKLNEVTRRVLHERSVFVEPSKRPLDRLRRPFRKGFDKFVSQFARSRKFHLFKMDQGHRLILDETTAQYYRRILEEHARRSTCSDLPQGSYVFATQPVIRQAESQHLHELFNRLAVAIRAHGGVPVLKLHPRETLGNYENLIDSSDWQLLETKTSLEVLSASGRISGLIGVSSTALLSGAALFGIKSYSIAPWVAGLTDDDFLKLNCLDFHRLGGNYVKFFSSPSDVTFE